ncbi:DUF2975 domain-containing protein [Paenibacillus methanolicus]|uniref:DUF2975 family protein n=1 Tax=Paenibacillus methanolicus TaxID=582686 RepID=A0A5S5CL67_9BACL|nr:DUF2975 domain-containing protein [Paenibacillus methanolicus]TYP79271.1 Protein of unknown function (DUF2975) [Paenibacillus methanolicus]
MSRSSILFLKGVLIAIGMAALAVCLVVLPIVASRDAAAHPDTAYMQVPFLAGCYALAVPFFISLVQAYNLLRYVERKHVFSEKAVRALKFIQYSTMLICAVIVAAVLSIMLFTHDEDITPFITLGGAGTFIFGVIAAFAALLIHMLKDAIAFKFENDLTV